MKKERLRDARRLALVCAGATVMALNIKSFVRVGGLYPGGFNGLTLLLQAIFSRFLGVELPFTLINLLLNSVPIVISFLFIGKKFTLFSCVTIVLSSVLTDTLPGYPLTNDPLLISVFGGIINALGISLCLFAEATSGGTDFIAIFMAERYNRDVWNFIFAGNVVILMTAGLLFGWDKALYSILFQFASTQIVHLLNPRYKRTTLFIISDKSEQIYERIRESTHHGATLFHGIGLYNGEPRSMIYSVIAGDQVKKITRQVREVDPHAFINILKTDQVAGNFYQRPHD